MDDRSASGQPPQAQWRSDLIKWSEEEHDAIETMLQRIIDAKPKQEKTADGGGSNSDYDALERRSDEEIFHMTWGVPNGRAIRGLLS